MKELNAMFNMPISHILVLNLLTLGLLGCGESTSSDPAPTLRYLQDQKGMPFPILGRSAWFITSLSETDYKTFIDYSVAKGYNAIEFHVINHYSRGNHPPFGGN